MIWYRPKYRSNAETQHGLFTIAQVRELGTGRHAIEHRLATGRWRVLPDHHLTVIEGIPTTRVARTLCDLAGVLHPARTERALDNCLSMGIVTPGTLQVTFSDWRAGAAPASP
jgi:hypothetical protein